MNEKNDHEQLWKEIDRAYSQLTEITSRLLAVNEAADLFASSHDREELATNLLEVVGRAVGPRTGAVFLAQGEGEFNLLASLGLEEAAADALEESLPDIAVCNLVENEKRSYTLAEAVASGPYREWESEQARENEGDSGEPSFRFYTPLSIEGRVLGVLALGSDPREGDLGDEEKIFVEHLAGQGALALDRAMLFDANADRLQDLQALLQISRELTSTLDLDRVLLTAVNTTSAIVDRERAVLALFEGDRLVIRAVSDFPRVDAGTAEKLNLVKLLQWLGLKKPKSLHRDASDLLGDEEIEGSEVLSDYFSGEMRSLLVIQLTDDQGPVGYLLFESFEEGAFRMEHDRDALTVLAGQLAVAIRNAELYRQLPMVSALAPLAERKRRWQRMTPFQRRRTIALAAVVLLVFAIIPWPRSVAGDAMVLPSMEVPVRTAVEGILGSVLVGPGEKVRRGQLLARLDVTHTGARLAELRAEALQARSRSAQAEDVRDPVERRMAELRREQAIARLAAAEREGGMTELVAPVDGVVLTPQLRERSGSYLEAGEILCQVSPLDTMHVDVAVSENDIHGVEPGQKLRIKVLGFPDRQFAGEVTGVSWQGEQSRPGRASHFIVRGWVANPGPELRSGMTGRARIDVESATLLWRWTRGLVRWVRMGLWV